MVLWQHVVLCKGTLLRMGLTVGVRSVLRCERLAILIWCCGSMLCCVSRTLLRMCLTVGVRSVLRCERLAILIGCCGSMLCCVRVRC